METIEGLYVCQDCALFIANGDLPEDSLVANIIVSGVEQQLPNEFALSFDENKDLDFSRHPCDCCGDCLAGYRHSAVLMQASVSSAPWDRA